MSEESHDLNRLLDKPSLGEGPAGYEKSFLSFTGAQRLLNCVLSLALVAVMTFTALGEVERTFWIDCCSERSSIRWSKYPPMRRMARA